MSHGAQQDWVRSVKRRFPEAFLSKRVLDIGSRDINGSNRQFFTDCRYTGIDVVGGRGVDIVVPAHGHLVPDGHYDTIISTEALEHDLQWMLTLTSVERMLAPGGLFVLTCATTGRAEHGTNASKPADCPDLPWPDYYRNVTEDDVRWRLDDMKGWQSYEFKVNAEFCDLYMWGVRA